MRIPQHTRFDKRAAISAIVKLERLACSEGGRHARQQKNS
jgi:hypothetical protein